MVFAGDGIGSLSSPCQPPQPKPLWACDSVEQLAERPELRWTSVLEEIGTRKPEEAFVVEPDPIFHEAPCSTMMETLETVSRRSFDSWSVPTLSDPQPPSNRVLHEAYTQQVTSFMKGVCKNPANLKKLISKSRGELPETKAGPFDSLGGGTPRTRMRFMASIPFLRGSWS
mmetsp:Transcript_29385/g.63707  ORF Transcript_29385/g.63707 Transcript_29385/m.63707 type:complete len:171 (+) Transcript_29385:28-540(+)